MHCFLGKFYNKHGGEWFSDVNICQNFCEINKYFNLFPELSILSFVSDFKLEDILDECFIFINGDEIIGENKNVVNFNNKKYIMKKSGLFFISARLGINKITNEYYFSLKKIFECKECIGIIGGETNLAHYFIGYNNRGNLIYLDPHITRESVKYLNDDSIVNDYLFASEIEILESSPYYKTAPLFYVTNIGAAISLSGGVKLKYGSNIFLKVDEGIYGKKGSDGGVVMVILTQQEIEGDIIVSSNSVVDLYLVNSKFKGKINTDKKGAAVNISLDEKSEITLTGNSYYTHLLNKDNTNSNIKKGSFQFDKYEARYIPNSPEEEKSSTDKPKENTLVEAEFLGYGGYKILNKTFFEFYLFFTNVDRSVLPKKFKIPFIANFNNNRRLRKLEPDVLECTLDENNKKISNYSCEGEVTDTSNIKNIGIDPTKITFVNLNVPPNADMNNIQNAKGNLFILSDSEYKTKEANKFSISGTIENFPLANGDELYLTPNKGKSQVKCNVGEINLASKKLTLDCDPNEKIAQSDLDNSISTFGTDKHTLLIQFKENKGNDGGDDGEKDGEKTIRKHVKKSGGGLSAGGIVGIVLGSLAVLSGIFITFYCLKNSGLKRQEIPNASVVSAKV